MGLDTQAATEAVLRRVAPELRAQLHETLERVAWEAFGQVTEKIVAQAVERVEAITWEVVPKLAETLILEEIRKLKGE
jgi:DNA replication initiation complex subunit (GINS family)